MKRYSSTIIAVLALVGAVIAGYLTHHYYLVNSGSLSNPSFCSISANIDCDKVAASKYSAIFGYPLSSLGLGFYLVMLGLALIAQFVHERIAKTLIAWVFLLSIMGLLFDIYLLGILIFRLKVLCLLCVATYVVNMLVCFVSFKFIDSPKDAFALPVDLPTAKQTLGFVALISGLLIAASVGADRYWRIDAQGHQAHHNHNHQHHHQHDGHNHGQQNQAEKPPSQEELREKVKKALDAIPKTNVDMMIGQSAKKGTSSPKVTIVEFSDFECPHCQRAASAFGPILDRYGSAVQLVFKHYPLDQACNPSMQRPLHKNACLFAKATLCARERKAPALPDDGKFWRMHDYIFENADRIGRKQLVSQAGSMDIDRAQFEQCLDSPKMAKQLLDDIQLGDRLQVQSTPTLFVNQRKWTYGTHPQILQALIEVELNR